MLKGYLKNIFEIASRGDDHEESYYSTLEALLKDFLITSNQKNIQMMSLRAPEGCVVV